MEGLKALIIENEYEFPKELQHFLLDNPKLFSDFRLEIGCIYRSREEILSFLSDRNAIIVSSQWVHKKQLEDYLQALTSAPFAERELKIFVYDPIDTFNSWIHKDANEEYTNAHLFQDASMLCSRLLQLVNSGTLYAIERIEKKKDPDGPLAPYTYRKVHYHLEGNHFYTDSLL